VFFQKRAATLKLNLNILFVEVKQFRTKKLHLSQSICDATWSNIKLPWQFNYLDLEITIKSILAGKNTYYKTVAMNF
jgi:hypothetical protein